MSVRIQLDKPHVHFTNLDLISGTVILSITGNETISLITVKLEGESRTRLAGPTNPRGTYDPYERDQAQLEVHKVSKYPLDATSLKGCCAEYSHSFFIRLKLSFPRKSFLGHQEGAAATRYQGTHIDILFNSRYYWELC